MLELLFSRDNLTLGLILGGVALTLIILLVVFARKQLHPVYGSVGILAIFAGLFLAIASPKMGTISLETSGNPAETVDLFYGSVLSGDYGVAYRLLKDYVSLGFENVPDSHEERQLLEVLKESYQYELVEAPSIDKLKAKQRVRFTYLDTAQLYEEAYARMDVIIGEKVQTWPRKESFDEEGNYRPELLEFAYEEAMEQTLPHSSRYQESIEYDVELEYVNGMWMILVNDEMLKGFLGGM